MTDAKELKPLSKKPRVEVLPIAKGYSRKNNIMRRKRIHQVPGNITPADRTKLFNKHKNKCLCCGRGDVELTLDHVIPLRYGGRNEVTNAQPLCRRCNSRKGTKPIDYRPAKRRIYK